MYILHLAGRGREAVSSVSVITHAGFFQDRLWFFTHHFTRSDLAANLVQDGLFPC